jgi:hypothetical protein
MIVTGFQINGDCDLIVGKEERLGSMTEARWTNLVEQMKELKQIQTKPKAADLYRNSL